MATLKLVTNGIFNILFKIFNGIKLLFPYRFEESRSTWRYLLTAAILNFKTQDGLDMVSLSEILLFDFMYINSTGKCSFSPVFNCGISVINIQINLCWHCISGQRIVKYKKEENKRANTFLELTIWKKMFI